MYSHGVGGGVYFPHDRTNDESPEAFYGLQAPLPIRTNTFICPLFEKFERLFIEFCWAAEFDIGRLIWTRLISDCQFLGFCYIY